jgi:hypothetical protein
MSNESSDILDQLATLRDHCTPTGFDICQKAITEIRKLREMRDQDKHAEACASSALAEELDRVKANYAELIRFARWPIEVFADLRRSMDDALDPMRQHLHTHNPIRATGAERPT